MNKETAGRTRHEAMVALLKELDELGYSFTAVTPATHARVLARRSGELSRDLRDVFGWSVPFSRDVLPDAVAAALEEAGLLESEGAVFRSRARVAELGGHLFLHSAYPTTEEDAVFFGPDTYRFVRFVDRALDGRPVRHLVDLGSGSGAGAIIAAALVEAEQVTLIDSNALANDFAAANAEAAGVEVSILRGDRLSAVQGPIDCVIANPPFIADDLGREYRDGGGALGIGVALRWAKEAMSLIEPGGTMLLYTGSPIVAGEDRLLQDLAEAADESGCSLRYQEIDADIFGEELEEPVYAEAEVDRIAAIGAVITRD